MKRESRAAACARCAARGAQCRGTLAARPLCGAYSSCRRLRRTYDSWHRIIFIYQGHTIEERWTSIVMTVILLSSSLVGPLLIHVGTLLDRCPWYMPQNTALGSMRREL